MILVGLILESDADEQLLVNIPFNQKSKVDSASVVYLKCVPFINKHIAPMHKKFKKIRCSDLNPTLPHLRSQVLSSRLPGTAPGPDGSRSSPT